MTKYRTRGRGEAPLAHKYWPDGWKGLNTDVFDTAIRRYYAERCTDRRVEKCRLAEGVISSEEEEGEAVGINEEHGVDFMNDVIPNIIEKIRQTDNNRKIRILDLGCGFGFFTDELRKKFDDDVVVFGTSIENPVQKDVSEKQKAAIVNSCKKGSLQLPENYQDIQLNEQIHPNDAKFRSVLEMRQFEEFDLIIDTSGEFLYSGKGFLPTDSYSHLILKASIGKLLPNGELYVSRVHDRDYHTIAAMQEKPSPESTIEIEIGDRGYYKTAFVIRKKATPNE